MTKRDSVPSGSTERAGRASLLATDGVTQPLNALVELNPELSNEPGTEGERPLPEDTENSSDWNRFGAHEMPPGLREQLIRTTLPTVPREHLIDTVPPNGSLTSLRSSAAVSSPTRLGQKPSGTEPARSTADETIRIARAKQPVLPTQISMARRIAIGAALLALIACAFIAARLLRANGASSAKIAEDRANDAPLPLPPSPPVPGTTAKSLSEPSSAGAKTDPTMVHSTGQKTAPEAVTATTSRPEARAKSSVGTSPHVASVPGPNTALPGAPAKPTPSSDRTLDSKVNPGLE